MKEFKVYPLVEVKSSDPEWSLWRVNHVDGKDYLLGYRGNDLVEVYFVGEGSLDYFMSCRTDMKTISHYFVDRRCNVVRRYEHGVRNRVYHDERNGIMWYEENGKRVEYKQALTYKLPDWQILYRDLEKFLEEFKKLGLKLVKPTYCI